MPVFEVYIPARDQSGRNVTLTVEAANWLGALQTGLLNSGEDARSVGNVLCDLQSDGSIHVTDASNGRVFRLRHLEATSSQTGTEPSMPAVNQDAPRFKTAPRPMSRSESAPQSTDPAIGRSFEKVDVEEVIADIFERTMDLYTDRLNPDKIVNDLLDLAMEKVPSDAGTFYVADISSLDLQFAAVRGPKAKEVLASGIRVPMGQGIAGVCALESISVAISDAQRDPRFSREISEKIGYEAHSMVCVPLDKDGRCYGAIQLINRQGRTTYTPSDMAILTAVGQQAVELLSKVQT
ncbi:MAG: GAF domain-containing protein [Pseudomonadota bacterium]